MNHPDRKTCYKYLKDYKTPKHVIGHCKSVAAVAYLIGKALNEAGGTRADDFGNIKITKHPSENNTRFFYSQDPDEMSGERPMRPFDLDLILAAGLLHDMARVEERHWDVGADFCHDRGLYEEEKIIRAHMQYQYTNDAYHLTEADLVCLGDRLTLEDRYAGLDLRMDYIIKKAERRGNFDNAREKILKKKEETRALMDSIEKRIGTSIDDLMKNIDYDNVENSD